MEKIKWFSAGNLGSGTGIAITPPEK